MTSGTPIASIGDVLTFWFGPEDAPEMVAERQSDLWWGKNAEVDRALHARFDTTMAAAYDNQLDHWSETSDGLLALILLLDQFPRNCFRNTPQAFAADELARQCSHLGLAMGVDQQLPLLQRLFFYLPLEHSEDLDDQEQVLQLIRQLARDGCKQHPAAKPVFDQFAEAARQHHAIISRFGRFPHRNAILGRASSAEETAFLQEPNSSF